MKPFLTGCIRAAALAAFTREAGSSRSGVGALSGPNGFSCPGRAKIFGISTTWTGAGGETLPIFATVAEAKERTGADARRDTLEANLARVAARVTVAREGLRGLAPVTDEALALSPLPRAIWTQLGVRDDAAAERARAQGIKVIQNRCPAIEIPRLGLPRIA